ncbi:MAG: L,D-transpeptidase family protein [Hyphomicrobiaceae bacterium]
MAPSLGLAAGRPGDARQFDDKAPISKVRSNAPAPRLAIVSLADQHIEVFEANGRAERSRISSGKAGHGTPTGVFSILQRRRYHESNLYSNAPMPYMQRLTWSGIALHEGYVPGYRASHGCIRMPSGFASRLWKVGYIGMRVIVSPRRVRPVEFAHPRLPTPAAIGVPQLAALVRVAASADDVPATPASLSPYEAAQHRLEYATAAKAAAEKAVKPALELAAAKSREATQAAAALKASTGILADAEEHLELENLIMATVQTEDAETAIRTRIRFAAAGVEAARESHEKLKQIEATASAEAFETARAARDAQIEAELATDELNLARKAVLPITLFISRKTEHAHVRQGAQAVFEAPVTIANPEKPLGTHVYTAVEETGATGIRWVAVSVPTNGGERAGRNEGSHAHSSASEALDRIELSPDVRRLMSERLWPGASIIVSDFGLGETNEGTEFVITTH